MIDLSVVIVNWNTRDLLKNCLSSLLEELKSLSHELFVVDNGSSDDSVAMVREDFPSVIVIENGRNLGFARANNIALRRAKGGLWLLLNSDTRVKEGSLKGLVQTMEQDPKIGVAGLQLLNEDGSLQNSVSNAPSLLTELGNKRLLRLLCPSRYPGKEFHYCQPLEVESVIGACMMVRGSAAGVVGLLDEDYFLFLEETDWCVRMRRAGWKVVFDPRFSLYHLQGRSAGKVNVSARIEYWRSRYTFFRKHHGKLSRMVLRGGLLLRVIFNLLAMTIGNLLICFSQVRLRNKLQVYFGIFLWHLRGCPADGGLER